MKAELFPAPGSVMDARPVSVASTVEQFGPRIEPCQFEQLLQRAMEILNQRHLDAQLKGASDSHS